MPKKQSQETSDEQAERFRREAQKLIDAGELNPTDAQRGMEDALRKRQSSQDENASS